MNSRGKERKARLRCLGISIHPRHNQRPSTTAANMPMNCAAINAMTPAGAIPAKVSDNERAIVTAGLANEVEAVNQYAAVM